METTAFTSRVKTTSLVLLTTAFAAVCNAAFTNPDGLWLIADDIPGTGAVSTWATDAGGGAALTLQQATAANQPTAVAAALNGHKIVTFNGSSSQYLATSGVTGSSVLSADQSAAVLVIDSAGAQSASWFGWVKTADPLANFYQTSETPGAPGKLNLSQGVFNAGGGYSVNADQPGNWATGFHVVSLIRNSDGTGSIRVDGAPLTTTPTFTSSVTTSDSGSVAVGGLFGGDFFTGSIAEIMLYKSASADVAAAESALFTKYGLTPVPEPSQYAAIFGVACLLGGVAYRMRRQAKSAA